MTTNPAKSGRIRLNMKGKLRRQKLGQVHPQQIEQASVVRLSHFDCTSLPSNPPPLLSRQAPLLPTTKSTLDSNAAADLKKVQVKRRSVCPVASTVKTASVVQLHFGKQSDYQKISMVSPKLRNSLVMPSSKNP